MVRLMASCLLWTLGSASSFVLGNAVFKSSIAAAWGTQLGFKRTRMTTTNTKATKDMIRQTDYLRNPKQPATKPSTNAKVIATNDGSDKSSPSSSLNVGADVEKCLSLLEGALGPTKNGQPAKAAGELLSILTNLRQQENDGANGEYTKLINELLEQSPDSSSLPFWTKIRFTRRYSKRARFASLRRTLDLTTPPPSFSSASDKKKDDTDDDKLRRRRRALVSILRSISTDFAEDEKQKESSSNDIDVAPTAIPSDSKVPTIAILEKKARQEQKYNNSEEDLTNRRPQGLETPNYVVVEKPSNTFEIRRYEDFAVCSVSMKTTKENSQRSMESRQKTDAAVSEPNMSGASAFGTLAGYLFGKNEQQEAMKMTTPVLTTTKKTNSRNFISASSFSSDQNTEEEEEGKLMSFVLPSEYWKDDAALKLAPQPFSESGVRLERVSGGERAVVMFGGYVTSKVIQKQTKFLLQQIAQNPNWRHLETANSSENNDVIVAQYNDPFTPPWKRLNEISIAVTPKK